MNPKLRPYRAMVWYGMAALLALCLLLWGRGAPKSAAWNANTAFPNINQGWELCLGEEWQAVESLRGEPYGQEIRKIRRTLPSPITTQYLLFYTQHQEVSVSIGGVCVYRYETPAGYALLQTPGNRWHAIALSPADAGQPIEITLRCPFAVYQGLPEDIFYLQQGELQIAQAYSIWFCNTVAIFMLILAVISFVNGASWKSALLKRYTQRLGIVYAFVGLWLLAEINIATLVLRNAITTYLFSMLLVRLLPLAFYHLFRSLSPRQTWGAAWGEWVFAANVFVPFLLQFTLGISLLETLNVTYLLGLAGIGYALACLVLHLAKAARKQQRPSLYDLLYAASALLLLGALGEIYCYAHHATLGRLCGTAISAAAIVYTIITRLILVRIETQFERETQALAQKNNALQLMPLTQQINAHFLFNTLNNISFLCKHDPMAADESVILLARYMREYMALVNTSDLIPFAREHALLESYLSIQKIRFQEKITFSIDPPTPAFNLPPLCIQPFVENAILHGIRHKQGNGTIAITRVVEGDFIKITVQDDGVGFDAATLQQSTHVGIQNVQRRLALYGGRAVVRSSPAGTVVDIFIPQDAHPLHQPNPPTPQ